MLDFLNYSCIIDPTPTKRGVTFKLKNGDTHGNN